MNKPSFSMDALWLPFTSNRQFKQDPRIITGAEGAYYTGADGIRRFDGLSGLWCSGFGHGRETIANAVGTQIQQLDYAPAFQFSHQAAFTIADTLANLCPGDLNRVFFVNSGSEAADTSLKMARAYWRAQGQPTKTRFIGRVKGYHGVNFAGTALGGIGGNRKLFGQLAEADHLPHTLLPENAFSRGQPAHGAELADDLENLVALHDASNIAAVIVEPFAGSAGVLPPPKGYLERLRAICDKHSILLIFDEVITGFGRTGSTFGAVHFNVQPDIMNLAKGLTNGTVPMGAVVVRQHIHDAFMQQSLPPHAVEFPHGYTYSTHPVACAAAIQALKIFTEEDMSGKAAALAPVLEDTVHAMNQMPHITDIRNIGLAAALQFAPRDGDPTLRPMEVALAAWERGLYLRWGGDTIQIAPPMIATKNEVENIGTVLSDILPDVR